MNHAALVFGREDSGLTNEELALADVLTGVPMVADYPSLNLGQSVMVYCYQLAFAATPATSAASMKISCRRYACARAICLTRLGVADDPNWPTGCSSDGLLSSETRQCCIVCCTILKKPPRVKFCHKFYLWFMCCICAGIANRMNCQVHVAHWCGEMGEIKNSLT
jgi:tRNA/rRNA methyltransferase